MSGIVAFEGELNSIVKEVCINNALFIIIVTLKDKKRLRLRVLHLIEFIQSNNFHIYSIF